MAARPTGRAVPRRRGTARTTVDAQRRVRSNPRAVRAVEESSRALNEWLGRPRVPAGVDRGDLAERMIPVAAALSCIVHGDGGAVDVEYLLGRLGPGEWPALVTVLAGMVDPDAKVVDVFGYLTWDEHERPLRQPPLMTGTVRDLEARWSTPTGVEELLRREGFTKQYVTGGGQTWVKERAA